MNSIEKLLESHPQYVLSRQICAELSKAGFQAYLAGGCVRDVLLSRVPNDFDIATSATPDQVEQLFAGQTVPVGKEFGVMIVRGLEVATFRDDGPYIDGRRPQSVQFCQAERDAQRRDFTVNALFYDFQTSQVIDYVQGLDDIRLRVIRAVGVPEKRFIEDHLRLLRAVRFVSQLGFSIEPKTWQAVCAQSALVATVSGERVFHELSKLLKGEQSQQALSLMRESGLLMALLSGQKSNFQNTNVYQIGAESSENLKLQNRACAFLEPVVSPIFNLKSVTKEYGESPQELYRWCDFFLWTSQVFAFSFSANSQVFDFYKKWLDELKMPRDLRKNILRALSWIWQESKITREADAKSESQLGFLLESTFEPENFWGMSRHFSLSTDLSTDEQELFLQWQNWLKKYLAENSAAEWIKPQAKVSAADVTQFYQAKGLESPRGEALGRALRFCFQQQLQFGHRTRGELLQSYLER